MNRAGGAARAVGIDVGGTKIAAGLVDCGSGRILAREDVPTRPERGGEAVLAVLANALDPELVVLGGGLGGEPSFRERVAAAVHSSIAYPATPPLEIVGSRLGTDGGVVGAALAAL